MYEIYERLLQEHGVTNYRISKETGIAQSVLSAWKNGISTPKQDKLKKIADYFGVSISYLLTGEDDGASDSDNVLKDKHEKNIIAMYRNSGSPLTDEEATEFEDMFKSTLAIYLKARGKK